MKRCLGIVLFLTLFCSSGCQSDMERLEDICGELEYASLMTDDCERMAKALAPTTKRFSDLVDHLGKNVPSEEKRATYVSKVSQCLRYYLEIETGTCGEHKAVQSVLGSVVQK